jgi:YggT family protein
MLSPLPVPAVPPVLPVPILSWIIQFGFGFLILAMLIRMIASWFRIDESFAIIRFLARVTDPFIQPCRRVMGTSGFIDLGFLVAWFLLVTLQILLLQSLPPGW